MTPEEIVKRVASVILATDGKETVTVGDLLKTHILHERERCAKIAESPACCCKEEDLHDGCCGTCGTRIATEIRKAEDRSIVET
mgnify:CR=1 FL=1